jgi:hypothetical protein
VRTNDDESMPMLKEAQRKNSENLCWVLTKASQTQDICVYTLPEAHVEVS